MGMSQEIPNGREIGIGVEELMARVGSTALDTTYARALQQFGEAGIVDILGVVGYYATNAMIMNVARTAVPGGNPLPLIPLPQQLVPLD